MNSQKVVTQNSTVMANTLKMRPLSASANPQASISITRRSLNVPAPRPKRSETINVPPTINAPPANCRAVRVSPRTK
jgi:hypothetical protein